MGGTFLRLWTAEQQQILESWGQGMAILAGAGSGKTTTLVEKCRRLLERQPQARVLAVSFTEKSARDLKQQLEESLGSLQPHCVGTLHHVFAQILSQDSLGKAGDKRLLSAIEAEDFWSQQVWNPAFFHPQEALFQTWLDREGWQSLQALLKRCKELAPFGLLEALEQSPLEENRSFAVLSRFVLERYAQRKDKAQVMEFQDLEQGVQRLLQQQTFDRKEWDFDLVLIDEFQDTNLLQADILWQLARPGGSNLCVVGDPQQAIYRFRDADVRVFEAFRRRLPLQFSLSVNFRTQPQLLSHINRLCRPLFEASQLSFQELVPPSVQGLSVGAQATLASGSFTFLEEATPADLVAWLHKSPWPLTDTVLLLRQVRGREAWIKGLEAAGLPCWVETGGFFWTDPIVEECLAFLRWWFHPASAAYSGAVFLHAPWMGYGLEALESAVVEDPSLLGAFLKTAHPVAIALKDQRFSLLTPSDCLFQVFQVLKGQDSSWDLCVQRLIDRLDDFSEQGLSFYQVLQRCQVAVDEKRREPVFPPPDDFPGLKILSIHAAKGLEFRQVVLGLLDPPRRFTRLSPLLWDGLQRRGLLVPRAEKGGRVWKDSMAQELRAWECQSQLQESKRLFYVGLTRVKESLCLVSPRKKMELSSDARPLQQEDWLAWASQ